jgi:hypothetical protein
MAIRMYLQSSEVVSARLLVSETRRTVTEDSERGVELAALANWVEDAPLARSFDAAPVAAWITDWRAELAGQPMPRRLRPRGWGYTEVVLGIESWGADGRLVDGQATGADGSAGSAGEGARPERSAVPDDAADPDRG